MPFLTAAWHDLIMVSWAVPPALLAPLVADGTELDLWEGHALVSIVAFDFRDTRVLGLPIPFHIRFPEVNLRFYVKRLGPDGVWRRGVTFVQELVPRRAIAFVARTFYGEPYVARPMRRSALPEAATSGANPTASRTVEYAWRRDGRWESIAATTIGGAQPMQSGSIEEFIAEHYWGYTRRAGRPTLEYRVVHPRWDICPLADCRIDADLRTLYGARFADVLTAPPTSRFLAAGSSVAVHYGTPLLGEPLTAP
jgi:uncharacterized protein